ncbi:Hemin transport system permease protein HmuU [Austwickia sp. TVS 96-490-7B]|uniref:FecCD family ABC transporter permease n=1 Tax=Austwickia sp. TVS 96-490-7B TaxID=2830843 RepID=UPI001E0CC591|nr:iron ABC transporter permease [Austwickia sp. TVS 96-490-7B]MBW3085507.1 Hemin transport system permease protein HmuU [Austwickia sp. TVS 96-490-7B]
MRTARHKHLWSIALAVAIITIVLISTAHGPLAMSPWQAARIVLGHLLPDMPWMSDGSITAAQDQVVWTFRLPRVLLAALAGACLSLAGALLQVSVRNPLAEPYILGISSGAGLGAVLAIVTGSIMASGVMLNLAAFIGAATTMTLVYLLALQRGVIVPARLILVGVALGSLLSALTNFLLMTTDAQKIFSILHFLLGSVSAATWTSLLPPAIALLIGVIVVGLRTRSLNALMVGDETATALGVDVPRLRRTLLAVTALLTAATVAVAGGIGFVGLIVPHVTRMIVGADHRYVIPVSVLGGAAFLSVCDLLARSIVAPAEIPLGILTAVAGAPFFLWLMRRKDS